METPEGEIIAIMSEKHRSTHNFCLEFLRYVAIAILTLASMIFGYLQARGLGL